MLVSPESLFVNKEYEEKLRKNLIERAKLLKNSENDPKLRACLIESCKHNPKFFFQYFLFTVKNDTFFSKEMPYAIPFNLFEFQEELVDLLWESIQKGQSVFIEKTRQMGFTWILLGVYLYGFLFHGHRYLIISRTAGEVDTKGDINSCFERLRFMLDFIPSWMLPDGFDKKTGGENVKQMAITRPDGPGSITGESANPNASRGGTYTSVFMDEMAFMQDAPSINKSASQATPCRIINSTPNGEGNEYFRMKLLAKDRRIRGVTLHWKLHPFYTQAWYDWKTNGMTDEQIAQELEINYNLSIEGRVYKGFIEKPIGDVDMGDYLYDYSLPLYVSIDNSHGGNDPHAVIVSQIDKYQNIIIIDCLQINCSITEIANLLAKKPTTMKMDQKTYEFYDRWQMYKPATFIADPYDTNSTWNDTSILNEYRKAGIILSTPNVLRGKKGNITEQIRLTTANLKRIKVARPRCDEFISALQNARYPQRKENSNATTENITPVHDWTSHFRTALEYLVLFLVEHEQSTNTQPIRYVEVANHLTGELERRQMVGFI